MNTQITARAVSKSYGTRLLFDQINCTVRPGERVGIVGENGAGKSTLLRLLAGLEQPDDGEITVTADGGVGHLEQTSTLTEAHTVADAVDLALADLRAIQRRLRELEARLGDGRQDDLAAYGELLTVFESRGGYEADSRIDKAMHGLGLAHISRERGLGSLSGGEQARLRLACLLAAAPEIMLLDEPTNHLDAAALRWLEDHLFGRSATLVVVSHDRLFLERVATAIVEVDGDRRTVTRYGNGYAGFLAEKAAARRRWEQDHDEWLGEVERLEEFTSTVAHRVAPARVMKDRNKVAYDRDAGRVQSSISSRVRNSRERLRRLREDPVPRPPDPLRFAARLAGSRVDGVVAALAGVRVTGRLEVDEFTVEGGERVLVHGRNGAGKSTLLRVFAGELRPEAGSVRLGGRIGYLAQESPVTRPEASLLAAFAEGLPWSADEQADRLLALGLFRADDLRVRVGSLSVGQRRRLDLARLLVRQVDLLLLDEPTNHLSPALAEEMEDAVAAYQGAVVIVSHDRRLLHRFDGVQIEMCDGRLIDDGRTKGAA